MQFSGNAGWVRLLDNESAVPTGSIWLGAVDPTEIVACAIRVRPAPQRKPHFSLSSQANSVRHVDHDLTGIVGDVPEADSDDIERIRDFVSRTKLEIVEVDPERRTVVVSGTASAMAEVVRAQLVRYNYARKIRVGYIAPIYVPAAIADIVERVGGFDDSSLNSPPSETTSTGPWIKLRRESIIPLLALVVGSAVGISLYGRVPSGRPTPAPLISALSPNVSSAGAPFTTADPSQGSAPSAPPVLRNRVPELETAGWQSLQANRLQDAQDYFLRALAGEPNRPRAMQGLVALSKKMAGDNPQVVRQQIIAYQDAIRRGSAPGEYYTTSALEFLLTANKRALRELEGRGEPAALAVPTPPPPELPNRPRPTPAGQRSPDLSTRQPTHAPGATEARPPRPAPGPSTQPIRVPPKAQDLSTIAPTAQVQKLPAAPPQGPPVPSAPAPAASPPPVPQPQKPLATPLPPRPQVTAAPPSGPSTPPAAPAPPASSPAAPTLQASPPPPNLLYNIRIGPVSDVRAAAIANALSVGGFSQARLGTETGFRVVSEPLLRNDAESLVARLAGRGIAGTIGPATGATVQVVFGAFTSQKEAEALSRRIANAGYNAWVRTATVYTLRVGPYPSSSVGAITQIVKAGDPEAGVVADPVSQP